MNSETSKAENERIPLVRVVGQKNEGPPGGIYHLEVFVPDIQFEGYHYTQNELGQKIHEGDDNDMHHGFY